MNVDFTSGDENYKKILSNCSYDMNYILKMNNLTLSGFSLIKSIVTAIPLMIEFTQLFVLSSLKLTLIS